LPDGCAVELREGAWEVPAIFRLIEERGGIAPDEMARVFNMGLGMVLFVAPEHLALVKEKASQVVEVGEVVTHDGGTQVRLVRSGVGVSRS
jgi:phosphoribosylformylglycinamidine cyclo-ligase